MPTPTRAFINVAARYGIDPSDLQAVQQWFCDDLPTLPIEQIEEILEELLAFEPTGEDVSEFRCYPEGVPLPSLDESPLASTPLFAAGPWKDQFRTLLVWLRISREK